MPVSPHHTSRFMAVAQRTAIRTWDDGFIHAGNLAYLSMLAIFPFFILAAALFPFLGDSLDQTAMIDAVLGAMPPNVRAIIEPVAQNTLQTSSGLLLWMGVAVGLWTISGLIESIRDVLRRAYDTKSSTSYWQSRLFSVGLILIAVMLMIASLFAQVAIGTAQQFVGEWSPQLVDTFSELQLSRAVPAISLAGSLYLLFLTLTPGKYRARAYPKWPGVLATSLWWLAVTSALPPIITRAITYDLIYGSLAGIMVVLFFFWLVGLGLVMGAELNASLAQVPEDETNTNEEHAE
ncbi:MAG: YihY/virulence factor BrkB family protein [Marinomonas sp.]